MTAAVDVAELSFAYPGASRPAVQGVSFAVAAGEVFGLLGPNGAGKSTIHGVLTRRLGGHEGDVRVLGRPLASWDADYYDHIGVGFELPAHFGKLTARENLEAFASLYAGPTEEPLALLARVDLADVADVRARELSKGMQMRLNLARALLHHPQVLFLDEPTSGLDPVHAGQIRALIRAQAEAGRAVLVTTHDMHAADAVCDRVGFLVDGHLAELNAPRALKLAHGRAVVTGEHRRDGALQRAEFPLADLGDNADFLALLRHGRIETLHSREATLDEVFAAVTGRTL